eukprot:CAMPEP_0119066066 /NCGR_PEP_ID=MMETSP1178-20130426/8733_1 /TAXON_ID=33656 /ORGANISM="unid sp, Strain CCMP2000" /LENGTH=109 /DNA_ID=CAMNT_0007047641 /DNA_START=123 /DNA_END=449 /DNA_ORIENTATION=+
MPVIGGAAIRVAGSLVCLTTPPQSAPALTWKAEAEEGQGLVGNGRAHQVRDDEEEVRLDSERDRQQTACADTAHAAKAVLEQLELRIQLEGGPSQGAVTDAQPVHHDIR